MEGIIERIWRNQTREGKDYWVLSIGGERYSVWDKDYMKGIQRGASVEYEWSQSGDFRNITDIRRTDTQGLDVGYKDRQIVKMACIKSAATLVGDIEATLDERGEIALGLARKFEKYVTEKDEDLFEGNGNHEREPGEEG